MKGQLEQELVHESIEPSELWHRRLAHVHYKALPIASKAVSGKDLNHTTTMWPCYVTSLTKNLPTTKKQLKRKNGRMP